MCDLLVDRQHAGSPADEAGGGTSSDGRGASGMPTSDSARSTVALTSEMWNGADVVERARADRIDRGLQCC